MAESKSLRIAYGEALAELGAENDKIVVLDADLSNATMTVSYTHLTLPTNREVERSGVRVTLKKKKLETETVRRIDRNELFAAK